MDKTIISKEELDRFIEECNGDELWQECFGWENESYSAFGSDAISCGATIKYIFKNANKYIN